MSEQHEQHEQDGGRGGTALVLGGGGLAGIAWELGVLTGLAGAGLDVAASADPVVGTSAGSVVGALVAGGVPLQEALAAQLEGGDGGEADEDGSGQQPGAADLAAAYRRATAGATSRRDARARLGAAALAAGTGPQAARRDVLAAALPVRDWPRGRRLLVVTVDAETGEDVVLDAASGAPLLDAVAASCAVPLVWPPMTVPLRGGPRRLLDGGVRSLTSADLAAGAARVLVLLPAGADALGSAVDAEVAGLREGGSAVAVVRGDDDPAVVAAAGAGLLHPASRAPSARAGLAQGRAAAPAVRAAWAL